MNKDLFTLIDCVSNNNDINYTDLNDNKIFDEVQEMICDLYTQFKEI